MSYVEDRMQTVGHRQLLAMRSDPVRDEPVDLHMRYKDLGLLIINVVYLHFIVDILLEVELEV